MMTFMLMIFAQRAPAWIVAFALLMDTIIVVTLLLRNTAWRAL